MNLLSILMPNLYRRLHARRNPNLTNLQDIGETAGSLTTDLQNIEEASRIVNDLNNIPNSQFSNLEKPKESLTDKINNMKLHGPAGTATTVAVNSLSSLYSNKEQRKNSIKERIKEYLRLS